MFLSIKCVICKCPIENEVISLQISNENGTITHATCSSCFEKTKDKWIENNCEIKRQDKIL